MGLQTPSIPINRLTVTFERPEHVSLEAGVTAKGLLWFIGPFRGAAPRGNPRSFRSRIQWLRMQIAAPTVHASRKKPCGDDRSPSRKNIAKTAEAAWNPDLRDLQRGDEAHQPNETTDRSRNGLARGQPESEKCNQANAQRVVQIVICPAPSPKRRWQKPKNIALHVWNQSKIEKAGESGEKDRASDDASHAHEKSGRRADIAEETDAGLVRPRERIRSGEFAMRCWCMGNHSNPIRCARFPRLKSFILI